MQLVEINPAERLADVGICRVELDGFFQERGGGADNPAATMPRAVCHSACRARSAAGWIVLFAGVLFPAVAISANANCAQRHEGEGDGMFSFLDLVRLFEVNIINVKLYFGRRMAGWLARSVTTPKPLQIFSSSEAGAFFRSISNRVQSCVSLRSSLTMGLAGLSPKGLSPSAPIWALMTSPPLSPRA